jgi:hypothetical protein
MADRVHTRLTTKSKQSTKWSVPTAAAVAVVVVAVERQMLATYQEECILRDTIERRSTHACHDAHVYNDVWRVGQLQASLHISNRHHRFNRSVLQ